MAKLLISTPGADLTIKNNAGKTAEQLARYSSDTSDTARLATNSLTNLNHKKIIMFRDGNHESVSVLFQPEVWALAWRKTEQGGGRINVPACPVI